MPQSTQSHIEAICLPAILGGRAASLMALLHYFDLTQWWPLERLSDLQFRQLAVLLAHARAHSPFHAERLAAIHLPPDASLDDESWRKIPILSRAELRQHGSRLACTALPTSHGKTGTTTSSGSTAIPIRVTKSALVQLMWDASVLRDELWHRDNPTGTIAQLHPAPRTLPPELRARVDSPSGLLRSDWGPPYNLIWKTGRIGLMTLTQDIADQADFIELIGADYICTFPSNLQLLKAHYQSTTRPGPRLRAIWVGNEILSPDLRRACATFFDCPVIESYSSAETGYIALQCPDSDLLHIQSETIKVEILDPDGNPCQPGQTGRVVVTPLHNFAMPLLRYEIGDEAEVGPTCTCGRGLPTLSRIIGRTIDYIVHRDGRRTPPASMLGREVTTFPNIGQYQIIQRSLERIEVMIAADPPFTPSGLHDLQAAVERAFHFEFEVDLTFHTRIPVEPGGKLRPFKSGLPEGVRA